VIELVREPLSPKKATVAEAEAATKRSAKATKVTKPKKAAATKADAPVEAETTESDAPVADLAESEAVVAQDPDNAVDDTSNVKA